MGKSPTKGVQKFTDEQIRNAVEVLRKFGATMRAAGRVPKEVYYAFRDGAVTTSVDLAGFQQTKDGTNLLLVYRKDEHFDGYHIPSAMILPGKTTEQTLRDLIRRELGSKAKVRHPHFLFHQSTLKGPAKGQSVRGDEVNLIYGGWVDGKVKEGQWFPIHHLPENIIPVQVPVIPQAIDAFLRQ